MLSEAMLEIYRPIWFELTRGEFTQFAELHADADGVEPRYNEDELGEDGLTLLDYV